MNDNLPQLDPETGHKFYKNLPESASVATKDDFFINGKIRIGLYYIIKSFHTDILWLHRIDHNFDFTLNVEPWLKSNNVWVNKNNGGK